MTRKRQRRRLTPAPPSDNITDTARIARCRRRRRHIWAERSLERRAGRVCWRRLRTEAEGVAA